MIKTIANRTELRDFVATLDAGAVFRDFPCNLALQLGTYDGNEYYGTAMYLRIYPDGSLAVRAFYSGDDQSGRIIYNDVTVSMSNMTLPCVGWVSNVPWHN